MTEQEWLACAQPRLMMRHLRRNTTEKHELHTWFGHRQWPLMPRKWRLYLLACCLRVLPLLNGRPARYFVEVANRHADQPPSAVEREKALLKYKRVKSMQTIRLLWSLTTSKEVAAGELRNIVGRAAWKATPRKEDRQAAERAALDAEGRAQCELIREIFGNPFRPVRINPEWLSPAVVALAQVAYDDRLLPSGELNPDRLSALATALEAAGYGDAMLLGHLCGPGAHVRGCWAVDAILGKS